jgi:MOSC domain-containing protein YiiM
MNVTSVNLGDPQIVRLASHSSKTGIYKQPVSGPVRIGALGLEGDFIASKKHHGGPDQAVYIYGAADYDWWSRELGREIGPGTFGENLTVSELESARFSIGDRLAIGDVILEVTAPRIPCDLFARRMDDPQFIQRFREAERPGLYCRVLREGTVQAGDEVSLEAYRGETVTLIELYRVFYEYDLSEASMRRLLAAPIAERARKMWEERLGELIVK